MLNFFARIHTLAKFKYYKIKCATTMTIITLSIEIAFQDFSICNTLVLFLFVFEGLDLFKSIIFNHLDYKKPKLKNIVDVALYSSTIGLAFLVSNMSGI